MGHKFLRAATLVFAVFCAMGEAVADEPAISVEARQRYPWNGLVDIKFTVTGKSGGRYDTSFVAKDLVGGTNITMKTIRKSDGSVAAEKERLLPGSYNWVWDAAADLPKDFECERVSVVATMSLPYSMDGLKVYWSFDGDANDLSGNDNNLDDNSAVYAEDRFGESSKAVYFNGETTLTMNKEIGVTNTMTIAFWAKPQKVDYYVSDINFLGNKGSCYRSYDFPMIIMPSYGMQSGEIGVALGMGRLEIFRAYYYSGTSWLNCYYTRRGVYGDGWHHYVITISNGGVPIVYMDGVEITGNASSIGSSLCIAASLRFGGRANGYYISGSGNQAYKGYIDDFMIYDRVLSEMEIKNLHGGWIQPLSVHETSVKTYSTDGLKVYWSFDGDANDLSGNDNNLDDNSAVYAEDRFGESSKAVYFNGETTLTMNKEIGVTNTMTIAFWAKPQKVDYYVSDINFLGNKGSCYRSYDFPMIIMPSYGMQSGEIGVALGMGRLEIFRAYYYSGTSWLNCYYTRRGVYGDGWHHYVITISNGGVPIVYMDGVEITGNASSIGSSLCIAASLRFGGRANGYYISGSGNQAYKGYIDDFMIYDRVLSEMEIKNLVKFKAE